MNRSWLVIMIGLMTCHGMAQSAQLWLSPVTVINHSHREIVVVPFGVDSPKNSYGRVRCSGPTHLHFGQSANIACNEPIAKLRFLCRDSDLPATWIDYKSNESHGLRVLEVTDWPSRFLSVSIQIEAI